ncbi:MAG: NAD-dependent epimerase/dehydratase family protein [Planctomycetota bacterium]
MARVLVTGASGFIGSHLVAALVARGDCVTALVRKTSCLDRLESLGVSLARGDVTDPASLQRAVADQSVVYHLAGLIRSLRTRQLYTVNGEGVHHIAEACAGEPEPPVLVVVSSLAAAGPSPNGSGSRPSGIGKRGGCEAVGSGAGSKRFVGLKL